MRFRSRWHCALRLLLAEIGTKTEKVSASKKLVVLSQGDVEDRPADARMLLGLKSGAVSLASTGCGGRDVFVQSTSGNRGLLPGSRMLFEVPFNPVASTLLRVRTATWASFLDHFGPFLVHFSRTSRLHHPPRAV